MLVALLFCSTFKAWCKYMLGYTMQLPRPQQQQYVGKGILDIIGIAFMSHVV